MDHITLTKADRREANKRAHALAQSEYQRIRAADGLASRAERAAAWARAQQAIMGSTALMPVSTSFADGAEPAARMATAAELAAHEASVAAWCETQDQAARVRAAEATRSSVITVCAPRVVSPVIAAKVEAKKARVKAA